MIQKIALMQRGAYRRIPLIAALLMSMALTNAAAQVAACDNIQSYNTVLNSQTGLLQTQAMISQSWSGDFSIALIAILISFIIATLIFMVGAAFKNDRVRNFGIGEYYEAIATALMVGFALIIAGLMVNSVPSYLLTTGPTTLNSVNALSAAAAASDPYVFTLNGICSTVNSIEYLYDYNLEGGQVVPTPWMIGATEPGFAGVASALGLSYNFTVIGSSAPTSLLNGAVDLGKLSDQLNYYIPMDSLGKLLTDLLYLLWGEYYLIIFFSFMAPVIISAGVVFRALFPLRGFGGMLIAIGMGFYIVLPLLFSFIYSQCLPGLPGCPIQGLPQSQNPFATILAGPPPSAVNISQYWLFFVLYPVLALSMTYVFIVQVANFIGASAQMGGRLRAGFV